MPRTKSGLLTSFTYMAYADWSLRVFLLWFILLHMTYDMTPLRLYVTCITIIDTIILTNYTNDAYTPHNLIGEPTPHDQFDDTCFRQPALAEGKLKPALYRKNRPHLPGDIVSGLLYLYASLSLYLSVCLPNTLIH
jgi:hypothetical protein